MDILYKTDCLTVPEDLAGCPQLPQQPQGTPQALIPLEEDVNQHWHYPAVSLLSTTTQPFPFPAKWVSYWQRSRVTKPLQKFLDFLDRWSVFSWTIWSCGTKESSVTTAPNLLLSSVETNWISHSSQLCWGLPGWRNSFFDHFSYILRHRGFIQSVRHLAVSFLSLSLTWNISLFWWNHDNHSAKTHGVIPRIPVMGEK